MNPQELQSYTSVLSSIVAQNRAAAENLGKMMARFHPEAPRVGDDVDFESLDNFCPAEPEQCRELELEREWELRRRRPKIAPLIALFIGVIAIGFVAGPPIYRFVLGNWKSILLSAGAAMVGGSVVLLVTHVDAQPLRKVPPPNAESQEPFKELCDLARRSAARLKSAYRIQLTMTVSVMVGLAAIVCWSMVMVSQKRLAYASVFGSSGIGMVILAKWKWQPFERVTEARKLAEQADVLATALRVRLATIQEIKEPEARAKAQWQAASEYLKLA